MDTENELLAYLGMKEFQDLFKDIPKDVRSDINSIGKGKSEMEVMLESEEIGSKNPSNLKIFLGLGAYERFIPSSVPNIIMRNEFITSYTPYQAEISQGMLHALFEYQSTISDLSKMDVTNSSMYDGPTGLGEAVRMAHRINGKHNVLMPENIKKSHYEIIRTYTTGLEINLILYPVMEDGTINIEKLNEMIDEKTSSIVTYNPSNYGTIDPGVGKIKEIKKDSIHIAYYDPVSIALIKSPGDYDADIAVGEGQQLGIPLSYGGPYLGLFSFKEKYVRKSPGRLIGETTDTNGKRAFVMTLQTREQHIRRDKAMSNICTNQALLAIASTAYLSILGRKGLTWVASKSMQNVKNIANKMEKVSYLKIHKWKNPFFTDFVVDAGHKSGNLMHELEKAGFLGGLRVSEFVKETHPEMKNDVFFAATELRNNTDIDQLISALEAVQ